MQNSDREVHFQVSQFVEPLSDIRGVRPGIFMSAVCIWISALTPRNRPFPGRELDVPRLTAPRGPARGPARANLRSLHARI